MIGRRIHHDIGFAVAVGHSEVASKARIRAGRFFR